MYNTTSLMVRFKDQYYDTWDSGYKSLYGYYEKR
jgi:hypothetical protein